MESIDSLVDIVFKNTPNKPNSFLVELDGYEHNPKLLHDLLINVLLLGVKKLYGENATPSVFIYDENVYSLLNQYMQSIGYNLNYELKNDNLNIWFDKYC
jgi:hypothetical protein